MFGTMFHSSDGTLLSLSDVIREVVAFMRGDSSWQYKIVIGTDSMVTKRSAGRDARADFVTAVVVHRVGNGGRYFWKKMRGEAVFNLRDRIIKEALFSLEVAREVNHLLNRREDGITFSFEVHADIGANGKTRELINEVVGMIRADNFPCQIKPFSFGASTVADRHV